MIWLAWVGPMIAAVIWLISAAWPDRFELRELEEWRKTAGPRRKVITKKTKIGKGAYRNQEGKTTQEEVVGARVVGAIPGAMARLVNEAGGGRRVGCYELAPKLAYMSVMDADINAASEQQTVTCKLEVAGPSMVVRPLPIVDGARAANEGVQFKKDPDFMEQYLVEGEATKAILKWLSKPLRGALLDMPELWLRVEGNVFSLTHYGRFDADVLRQLVATADVIFAEHGADGGPSLVHDEEPSAVKVEPAASEAETDDEAEDDDALGQPT